MFHHYAGAPLELRISPTSQGSPTTHVLGDDVMAGETPQVVVPAGSWQSSRALGAWSLVGCTVAPGFEFAGFELAPSDWEPGPGSADPTAPPHVARSGAADSRAEGSKPTQF